MSKMGKFERIELREVWAHEAQNFSQWLAQEENLSILSDAIDIDIILEELESPVGSFSVDLSATEENTGRKIIIENQLEGTDHDHLGKIITYASGKDAEIVIWIVKRARDEHRRAVEWLNEHTDANIGFFLLEIEVWKIDNSSPAPKFNVVERPNDWTKTLKTKKDLTKTTKLQLEFWQAFKDYAFLKNDFSSQFSPRKAQAKNSYRLSTGSSSYFFRLKVDTQKHTLGISIYIKDNKELFEKIKSNFSDIEEELGVELSSNIGDKDCTIIVTNSGDIKVQSEKWTEYFDWYCDMLIKLKKIVKKYVL